MSEYDDMPPSFIFLKMTQSDIPIDHWDKDVLFSDDSCSNIIIKDPGLRAELKPSPKINRCSWRLYINDLETSAYTNGNKKWVLTYYPDGKGTVLGKAMWKSGKTKYVEFKLVTQYETVDESTGLEDVCVTRTYVKSRYFSKERQQDIQ